MAIISEIKENYTYSLMASLTAARGFFSGNIVFDRPIRPEMGLSDSLKQQNEVYEIFNNEIVSNVVSRYAAVHNTPMVVISQVLAIGRYPTNEEIEHDLDHFGIEQMLYPKDYYAKQADIRIEDIDPKLPRYKFPKGSFMGSEEYIYVGPMRMKYAQCATFIDRYPLRTSLEYMLNVIQGMKPGETELEKDQVVGDGGYIVAATAKGVRTEQKAQRRNMFGGVDDAPIHDPKAIDIPGIYKGLAEHVTEHKGELDEHVQTIMQDFIEKWPHELHHGILIPGKYDLNTESENKHIENWYLEWYNRWKQENNKQ